LPGGAGRRPGEAADEVSPGSWSLQLCACRAPLKPARPRASRPQNRPRAQPPPLPNKAPNFRPPPQLLDFDYLISKKKVEEDDDFEALVNQITKYETGAIGDLNMRALKKGDVLQLERRGYYIVDRPWAEGAPAVLLLIPDGRARTKPVGRPVAQGAVTEAVLRR
jgi:hypothetical protein